MPPHLPGTGFGEPPGPSRREGDYAERPAVRPEAQFGHRPAHAVPPPLHRSPQLRRPQPWPLQQPTDAAATSYQGDPNESYATSADFADTPAPTSRRRHRGSAIAYTTLGFLAGVVFWHAVGFWTLVHRAVFSGPRLEVSAEPAIPVVTARPVVAFDEEKLRDSARRPSANDPWQRPQNITTGSIGTPPAPVPVPAQPHAGAPAQIENHTDNAAVQAAPGGISWQPAVSRAVQD